MRAPPRRPDHAPLLDRLCGEAAERPPDPSAALARALRAALLTRSGEAAATPELGTPGFAELVHGDKRALIALQRSLRTSLGRLLGGLGGAPIEIAIDRGSPRVGLRIAVALGARDRDRPGAAAEATIDACGRVRVDAAGGRR